MSTRLFSAHPMRVLLACFVAQGAWWLLTLTVIAGALVAAAGSDVQELSLTDLLVDGTSSVAGASSAVVSYVLVLLATLGVLLIAGTFVVPMLLRIFVRIICSAQVGYAWALVANLASWIILVAVSMLLWLIPGAQPIAAFVMWFGSSVMTAALLYPRVRLIEPARPIIEASPSEPAESSTENENPAPPTTDREVC